MSALWSNPYSVRVDPNGDFYDRLRHYLLTNVDFQIKMSKQEGLRSTRCSGPLPPWKTAALRAEGYKLKYFPPSRARGGSPAYEITW